MQVKPATSLPLRAADFFDVVRGPLASVRSCHFCKHVEIYRYTGGHRGAGMVGGNKARGRMIQHIKKEHADALLARIGEST